jgi:hypothetical protein
MSQFPFNPLGGYLIGATGVVALLFGIHHAGFSAGVKHERKAEEKAYAAALDRVAKREKAADQIAADARSALSDRQVQIQTVTRTLIEKVPTYVTAKADAGCVLPVGFVRLHDAAASGSPAGLSGTSSGSIDAPSGLALSAVAETVSVNYGEALQWRAEAQGWRDWYVREKALWDRR